MNQLIKDSSTIKSWNDCFLCNIDIIDNQHKCFFQIFDLLLCAKEDDNKEYDILKIIDDLEKFALDHFETEESLMKRAKYQDLEIHIDQHAFFFKQIKDFRMANSYNNSVLLDQLIIFMRKWILTHIYDDDNRYVEKIQHYLIHNGSIKHEYINIKIQV